MNISGIFLKRRRRRPCCLYVYRDDAKKDARRAKARLAVLKHH